jgi:hypothetical protein
MRVLLSAACLIQAVAFLPAHADDRSLHAKFTRDKTAYLEKAFWVCDYAGTNGMVGADQAAACIAITDGLKRMKFDGDFDRLVARWKLNKVAQHQELDRVKIAAN